MQVNHVAQAAYVLRGLIADTSHIIVINQELQLAGSVHLHFIYIDHRAIGNAAHLADAHATLAFALVGTLVALLTLAVDGSGGERLMSISLAVQAIALCGRFGVMFPESDVKLV